MKYYEVQEWEAHVRSVLSFFGLKEEHIDNMIKDDIYLESMKKGDEEMESGMGQPNAATPKKVFECIVEDLTGNVQLASRISMKSTNLINKILGIMPELDKEKEEKAVPPDALTNVLREINGVLNMKLQEIEQNLERLENAW